VDPSPDPAAIREALLALHKAVLLAERRSLEGVHGRLSHAEFLQIVQDPVRYGWLKPFTGLLLDFDAPADERPPDEELLERARVLLSPPRGQTPFGRRYLSLMQREPALVLAHADATRRLRI
jgi:hypothetical protein